MPKEKSVAFKAYNGLVKIEAAMSKLKKQLSNFTADEFEELQILINEDVVPEKKLSMQQKKLIEIIEKADGKMITSLLNIVNK